jgi:hypothetical protein
MAWVYLVGQKASSGPAAAATTAAINTTGASLIVVAVGFDTADTASLTDSQSNTWTALTAQANGGKVQLLYVANPTTSASHTFTSGAQSFGKAIIVAAFSGTTASPFDAQNGAASNNPGTVTNTGAGQLLVGACQDASGGGPVFGGPVSCAVLDINSIPVVGGSHYGLGVSIGYNTNGAGGVAGFVFASGIGPSSVISTFKITSGGGGGTEAAYSFA